MPTAILSLAALSRSPSASVCAFAYVCVIRVCLVLCACVGDYLGWNPIRSRLLIDKASGDAAASKRKEAVLQRAQQKHGYDDEPKKRAAVNAENSGPALGKEGRRGVSIRTTKDGHGTNQLATLIFLISSFFC